MEEGRVGMAWCCEEDEWVVSLEGSSGDRVSDASVGGEGEGLDLVMMLAAIYPEREYVE